MEIKQEISIYHSLINITKHFMHTCIVNLINKDFSIASTVREIRKNIGQQGQHTQMAISSALQVTD